MSGCGRTREKDTKAPARGPFAFLGYKPEGGRPPVGPLIAFRVRPAFTEADSSATSLRYDGGTPVPSPSTLPPDLLAARRLHFSCTGWQVRHLMGAMRSRTLPLSSGDPCSCFCHAGWWRTCLLSLFPASWFVSGRRLAGMMELLVPVGWPGFCQGRLTRDPACGRRARFGGSGGVWRTRKVPLAPCQQEPAITLQPLSPATTCQQGGFHGMDGLCLCGTFSLFNKARSVMKLLEKARAAG